MSDAPTDYRALGFAFLTMGVGITVSLGLTLGPAFFGIGLPFAAMGIVFLARAKPDSAAKGDE